MTYCLPNLRYNRTFIEISRCKVSRGTNCFYTPLIRFIIWFSALEGWKQCMMYIDNWILGISDEVTREDFHIASQSDEFRIVLLKDFSDGCFTSCSISCIWNMMKWYSVTLCYFLAFFEVTDNTWAVNRENTLLGFSEYMIEAMKFTRTQESHTSDSTTRES